MSRTTDYILDVVDAQAELWNRSCGYVKPTPQIEQETPPIDYVVDDKTEKLPF